MSRVSIRMLRHYDEIGLLRPVKIDQYTGYRYYSEEQLPVMARISLLRDVGFGLAAIKEILKCYDNKEELERYLQLRYAELMEASEETARRLRILDTALKRLRKDEEMKYDVILKTLPERHVASVRQNIPQYDEEGMLWHILFRETEPLGVAIAGPPYILRCFPRPLTARGPIWPPWRGKTPSPAWKRRALPCLPIRS